MRGFRQPWHQQRVARIGVPVALVLAAFGVSLGGAFVYDDDWTLRHNAHLGDSLASLMRACWHGEARDLKIPDATRPAMIASTWIDHRLFGLNALGYHVDSLLLAAAASVLAGLAVFGMVRRTRFALLAAGFFAAAPLHAEVVSAVNDREDLLAAIGIFGALALLFRPRTDDGAGAAGVWRIAGVAAAWLLALCAKESAVVLVPLVACVLVLQPGARRRGWVQVREGSLLALLATFLVWGSWRFGLRFGGDDVPLAKGLGAVERLLRTARYESWAVGHELLPLFPSPEHARPGPASMAWLAVLAAIVAATVGLARRRQTWLPALGLALAGIAPLATSPLVGPINELADRYLFVGVLGGAIVWAWAIEQVWRRAGSRVALVVCVVLACILVARSARSAAVWHDERSLWTEATRDAPSSSRAWAGLSRAARLEGHVDEALTHAQRAIALDPSYAPAHLTQAYNLIRAGRLDEAQVEIDFVERHAPESPGLARARGCIARPAAEAASCIDAP